MSANYRETNKESSMELFNKGYIYYGKMLEYDGNYPNITNFNFAEKFFYGRTNRDFIPIQIMSNDYIKGFKNSYSNTATMQDLNFVVDAFHDLAQQFTKCAAIGKISVDDPYLSNLIVYKAYQNPSKVYENYREAILKSLSAQFKEQEANVKNFNEFIEYLLGLLRLTSRTIPFTKPAFIKSRRCPMNVSGLVVEIADLNPVNDDEKINLFVNSLNWEFYLNTCKSYGFMVDQAVPWRLVADIGSPVMLQYAAKYGWPKTDMILWNAYTFAHVYYLTFKSDLLRLYNMSIEEFITETEECNGRTISKSVTPRQYTYVGLENKYPETYFLELYFEMRFLEEEIQLTDYQKESLVRDCLQINDSEGLYRSLYIFERILNKPFDYRGSLTYNEIYFRALADER